MGLCDSQSMHCNGDYGFREEWKDQVKTVFLNAFNVVCLKKPGGMSYYRSASSSTVL